MNFRALKTDPLLSRLRLASGTSRESPQAKPSHPPLAAGDVDLGTADTGGPVGLNLAKLIDGRLLIQSLSGGGKSWTLRRLIEQTAATFQQIILDPEGEFGGIAEAFGHSMVDAHRLDPAALAVVARRAREHRLSIVVDLSDVDRQGQMQAFASILVALIEAPPRSLASVPGAGRRSPFVSCLSG